MTRLHTFVKPCIRSAVEQMQKELISTKGFFSRHLLPCKTYWHKVLIPCKTYRQKRIFKVCMQKLLTERDLENFLKELFNFHTNLKLEYIGIHFCRIHFHKNNSDQMSQCSQVSRITLLKGVLWEREVGRWVGMKVKDTCLFQVYYFWPFPADPNLHFWKFHFFFLFL